MVKGKTIRKIKLGEEEQRSIKIIKKPVFITIKVDKTEFHKYSNSLRVSGIITEAPEDIHKGSYHTFNVEEDTVITIIKEKLAMRISLSLVSESTVFSPLQAGF